MERNETHIRVKIETREALNDMKGFNKSVDDTIQSLIKFYEDEMNNRILKNIKHIKNKK